MKNIICKNINDYNKKEIYDFLKNINPTKKEKINKIKNENDKLMSILGEYLLSKLLKENYNIDYNTISFNFNTNGKPYIINHNIYFNISHSHNYVACIISDRECGIDIEKIRQVDFKTINIFATVNEQNYILKDSKNIYKRLFEIYTLKESYIKMKGLNLQNINSVEFNINNKNITCSEKTCTSKILYFKDYIISICEKNEL